MASSRLVRVVELIHRRRARREARARSATQRALQVGALLLGAVSIVLAGLALVAVPFYSFLTFNLPDVSEIEALLDPQNGSLLEPTRFYDRTGEQLLLSLEPDGAPRRFVENLDQTYLAAAFVASSDPDFFSQREALVADIAAGPFTIAQRLAADLLLAEEADGWLKTLRARMLAADMVRRYGREQVLTWALNSTTFGHWTFGAESAAQLYFGKSATELSLAEAGLLAAVAQAPALNPIDAPELAIEFQRLVLISMRDQDLIDDQMLAEALTETLVFAEGPSQAISLAPNFTDLALSQLQEQLGIERVQRGGLEVITTLDYTLQAETTLLSKQGEFVVLDASTGQILAMAASGEEHAAGDLINPFIALRAFAQGSSPASLVWDIPDETSRDSLVSEFHGPTSLREALANNYAAMGSSLRSQIGEENLEQLLNASSMQEAISLVEAVYAYSVFANLGTMPGQAQAILVVHDHQNIVLDWSQPQLTQVTSAELAYLVTDVLSDASVHAESVAELFGGQRPAAVQGASVEVGAWLIGFSPQRVVAMWSVEQEIYKPWSQLFEAAHQDLPIRIWEAPPGLISVIVCVPSGQLLDASCSETRREFFLSGAEPTQSDMLFAWIAINSLNGLRATVFTPTEFIDEELFMNIPAAAEGWAQAAGIPFPPRDYDAIPALDLGSAETAILQPAAFSEVSGIVTILARLPEGSVGYDIQIGQGLYPEEWLLIAKGESRASVNVGWDTSGLSGLYAIQLQAWDENGNLSRAYTIVTIGK